MVNITLTKGKETMTFTKYIDAATFLGCSVLKLKAFANVKSLKLFDWVVTINKTDT